MTTTTDIEYALQRAGIPARFDWTTRILYSTDASIYQVEPLGVVFPRSSDELVATVAIASGLKTPVLARGAGSSLAGQAIGRALIVDCSRYLDRIIEINPEERTACVEPGVILNSLNRAAGRLGLQFGPDPASAERATIGGSLANNATGAHSILYGMAADHLLSADVILADGSTAVWDGVPLSSAASRADGVGIEASIYAAALQIRDHYSEEIKKRWPLTWRRAAGYNLNYLLPWSPSSPPGWSDQSVEALSYPPIQPASLNLAPLLAGSEGTLAVIRHARLRLVPLPRHTVLGILAFECIADACDVTPHILELHPSAVEVIPGRMIDLARSVPAFARQASLFDEFNREGKTLELLAVEFAGDDPDRLLDSARRLGGWIKSACQYVIADSADRQKQIWSVRKVGLGLLASEPGARKSASLIEDLSVPVGGLGNFVREMENIFAQHGVSAEYYAHASAGCLHIRPLLDLKSPEDVIALRSIASEAVRLTIGLGGAVSGEHGMGMARSEWMSQLYGDGILEAFRLLKNAADPHALLNPGKLLNPPKMDENLRYGAGYRSYPWPASMDFSEKVDLEGAIDLCNGAGVCRKLDGVLCPSYQATREEMHSTRGRANLLRTLISRPPHSPEVGEANQAVYQALDLCLACKACRAECPSSVDMAKLKYEFLHHYYQSHPRRLRDYIFAFIGPLARLGHPFAFLVNPLLRWHFVRTLAEKWLGLSEKRPFPRLSQTSLHTAAGRESRMDRTPPAMGECILLSDPFTEYFYPEVGLAAIRVLAAVGYRTRLLPVIGAGRTMLSKGFLDEARRQATRVVAVLEELDPEGRIPVIGLEPSEIYTLRDEFLDLLPGHPAVKQLAERAWMIDEFLVRPGEDGMPRLQPLVELKAPEFSPVKVHGHCYQKAQPPRPDGYPEGTSATQKMLSMCGYPVTVMNTGCCGMAGAFGYETEHYDLSMGVGELSLFPSIREDGNESTCLIAASGVSCKAQIEDGTGRRAYHPIQLIEMLIRSSR